MRIHFDRVHVSGDGSAATLALTMDKSVKRCEHCAP